ncbi:MAG: response regulator [Actinobacteria bacterium]|nr:response regulator [Actinomycetota bacterium]
MARILLVDDDGPTLDVLTLSLTLDGHEAHRAENGRDGIALAAALLPDLIVLDQMMPVMDGLTAARHIRATAGIADTPIVMLTAKVMESDVWAGWQAGVDSYLTKPLDLDVLTAEMARLGITPDALTSGTGDELAATSGER